MKLILNSVLVVAAMAGTATLAPGLAAAGVSIGIGIPAVVVAPGPGYVAYDEQYYYDPIYIGGAWYHGPYRWRMSGGERMFFVNGRWERNEWRGGRMPESVVFHNGGSFRAGRYEGFEGAERINARFKAGDHDMRQDHRELNSDRRDVRQDRHDMREDRNDAHPNDGDNH
jgi:hypothetical protein